MANAPVRRKPYVSVPDHMTGRADLDTFDIQLLELVQENNQLTAHEMAARIPLSPSAIARRLRHLRDIGAIQREVAVIAPWVAGKRLTALVHVYLEIHRPKAGLESLRKRLIEAREVQLCMEVSGRHDMIVILVVESMEEFNAFADELFAENPIVRRFETSFVKKRMKMSLTVPLTPPYE
jgi:Lrp/AsnC family transcriptional regulator, leucine-responsive regulatory protein